MKYLILILFTLVLSGCVTGPSDPYQEALFQQRLDNFNNTYNAPRRSQTCGYSAGMYYCW